MRATTATDLPEDHWTTISETLVHDGRLKVIDHEVALPDGTHARYEVDASVSFAVAVLLVLPGDEMVLTRQYRYPIDRWILDLPAGGGNAGEDPRDAAIRECEEETGLVPTRIEPLHTFFPNPGRSSWPVHLFIGFGAEPGTPDLSDPSEQVRVVRMPIADLDERIRAGQIVDPTLLVARLMARARGYLP